MTLSLESICTVEQVIAKTLKSQILVQYIQLKDPITLSSQY